MPLSTRSFASPFLVAMLRCRRALFVNLLWTTLFVGCAADESVGPQDLTPVVFAYCPSGVPLWAAFRNEGAAWQRLEFDASGRTEFAATPRFGMAFVTSDQLSIASRVRFYTTVMYTTAANARPRAATSCGLSQKVVVGAVTGLSAEQSARVSLGIRGVTTKGAYTLASVSDGPLDLFALRHADVDRSPDRIIIRRSLNPASGSTLPLLDFASSEAVAVTTNALQVAGLQSGERNSTQQEFISATTIVPLFSSLDNTSASIAYGVPATNLSVGDYHRLTVSTYDPGFSEQRTVVRYYRSPDDQSIALGRPLAQPTITVVATAPNQLLRLVLPSQAEYANGVVAYFWQDSSRAVQVGATSEYVGGTPGSWSLEIPDFSALPGWQVAWGLGPAGPVPWAVIAFGGDDVNYDAIPPNGATTRYAMRLFGPLFPDQHSRIPAIARAELLQSQSLHVWWKPPN